MQQPLEGEIRCKCKKSRHHHQQKRYENSFNVVKTWTYSHLYSLQQKDQLNEIPLTVNHSKCPCLFVSSYFINLLYLKGRANSVMLIHAIGHAILEIYMLCLTHSFRFF